MSRGKKYNKVLSDNKTACGYSRAQTHSRYINKKNSFRFVFNSVELHSKPYKQSLKAYSAQQKNHHNY